MRRLLACGMALALSIAAAGASGRPQPKPGQIVSVLDTTLFDPDGNYFPVDTITVGGYRLDSFSLGVLEYSYNKSGLSDSAIYTPSALLELAMADSVEGGGVADFVRFSPDTLELVFHQTEIGTVRISGFFLDKRGRFDRPEIEPERTPVLRARVTVTSDGRTVYSRRTNFTYWEGD